MLVRVTDEGSIHTRIASKNSGSNSYRPNKGGRHAHTHTRAHVHSHALSSSSLAGDHHHHHHYHHGQYSGAITDDSSVSGTDSIYGSEGENDDEDFVLL